MNWEKIDLYIENIIPGIAIVSSVVYFMGWLQKIGDIKDQSTYILSAFIAISYLVGVVANIFSRMTIDTVCKRYVRERMFKFFLKEKLNKRQAIDPEMTPSELYSRALDVAIVCKSKDVVSEILRRRQTGRLVRSSLIPGICIILAISSNNYGYLLMIAFCTIYSGFIVIIYGFGECTIFQEALRGERIGASLGVDTPSQVAAAAG